jgi:outer membrane protein assembly factor BamB
VNGLFVLMIHEDNASFTTAWKAQNLEAGPPIVTGGVVWAIDVSSGMIHAFRISDGRETFVSGVGGVTRFTTPTSGGGRIFVGTKDHQVVSFVLS